jgi:hypothetical protein
MLPLLTKKLFVPCNAKYFARKPSVLAHRGRECCAGGAVAPDSRRARMGTHSTGAADEMRLGLRRAAYRAQYARALHHMREAAGSFRPHGPRRRNPHVKRGRTAGAVDALRLGLRRLAHRAPDALALHNLREAAGSL